MSQRLYYVANIRFPTEKAHGIQVAKMCEAFADEGADVTLVIPRRRTPISEDPFAYYGVRKNFKIKRLFTIDAVEWGRLGFLLQATTFAIAASIYAVSRDGLFYTRDELLGAFLKVMGKRVAWEVHMGQENMLVRYLIRSRVPLIAITQGLKDLYASHGMPEAGILVAPDGVDIKQFNSTESRDEARRTLGLPLEKSMVLYTGHLYSWKGADTLAESARELPPTVQVMFLGGTQKDIESFARKYGSIENVRILGKKPHAEMPVYMRAADVLVIPNSAKEDISRLYTSPMKLFEYMASGTPIVASDLPSLREVIDESTAYFAAPDQPSDLARAVRTALENQDEARARAKNALDRVKSYAWGSRARTILSFV